MTSVPFVGCNSASLTFSDLAREVVLDHNVPHAILICSVLQLLTVATRATRIEAGSGASAGTSGVVMVRALSDSDCAIGAAAPPASSKEPRAEDCSAAAFRGARESRAVSTIQSFTSYTVGVGAFIPAMLSQR
jgi:hypothetical protein